MAPRDQMKSKRRQVVLIKKFTGFEDKVIYKGTYRKAKKLIPPSKKDQYKILFIKSQKDKAKEALMKKGSFKTTQTGNRRAYFILESQTNEKGEFRALIAVENESGYYKTDWFWGKILTDAEQIARDKNLSMGITEEEACKIVGSTMRKGAIETPRF